MLFWFLFLVIAGLDIHTVGPRPNIVFLSLLSYWYISVRKKGTKGVKTSAEHVIDFLRESRAEDNQQQQIQFDLKLGVAKDLVAAIRDMKK